MGRAATPARRTRQLGYQPALDGIRGVAILIVITSHALVTTPWQDSVNGGLGVDMFFVLSGFLITVLLLQERERAGRISLRNFYVRRALRLMPALAVGLAGYLILVHALAGSGLEGVLSPAEAWRAVAVSAGYVSNVAMVWGGVEAGPLEHFWSLAEEEQFYLLWPAALLGALHLRLGARTILLLLVFVISLLALHRLRLTLGGADPSRLYAAPDTHFDPLLIGCLSGVLFHNDMVGPFRRRRVRRLVWPPALALICAMVVLTENTARAVPAGLLVLFALATAAVIGCAVLDPSSLLARTLARRNLVYIGTISYGLYIWHPIVIFTVLPGFFAPLGVLVSIVVAGASYRFLERPLLRLKPRTRPEQQGVRQWLPAAADVRPTPLQ